MISAWTKHLKTEDDKARFKNELLGSKRVLNRLQELLKEQEDELTNTELSNDIYDLPNWDYRQADINGRRKALKTIKFLLTIDQ